MKQKTPFTKGKKVQVSNQGTVRYVQRESNASQEHKQKGTVWKAIAYPRVGTPTSEHVDFPGARLWIQDDVNENRNSAH